MIQGTGSSASPAGGYRSEPLAPRAITPMTSPAPTRLELLEAAPDPRRGRRLSRSRLAAALRRARRHDVPAKVERIQAALRSEQLALPPELVGGYAAAVRGAVAVIRAFDTEITKCCSSR